MHRSTDPQIHMHAYTYTLTYVTFFFGTTVAMTSITKLTIAGDILIVIQSISIIIDILSVSFVHLSKVVEMCAGNNIWTDRFGT